MHVHVVLLLSCIIVCSGLGEISKIHDGSTSEEYQESDEFSEENIYKKYQESETDTTSSLRSNTTGLLDLARAISYTSLDTLQKLAYKIILTYNNLFNIYSKRARAISMHMHTTDGKLLELEEDIETLVEGLYVKYETANLDKKPVIKKLLDTALIKQNELKAKKMLDYSVLECGKVMGKYCKTDDDCYGNGCLLQCKASGFMWWSESVCR